MIFIKKINLSIKKVIKVDIKFSLKLVDQNIIRLTHSTTISNLSFKLRKEDSKTFLLSLVQLSEIIKSLLLQIRITIVGFQKHKELYRIIYSKIASLEGKSSSSRLSRFIELSIDIVKLGPIVFQSLSILLELIGYLQLLIWKFFLKASKLIQVQKYRFRSLSSRGLN